MVYIINFKVDGGCRNNGYSNAYGAAAAVRDLKFSTRSWTRRLPTNTYAPPTSQRAELTAIIMALELAITTYRNLDGCPYLQVTIKSDSQYAVACMTKWINKWSSNGWINAQGREVANRDLIEEAYDLGQALEQWEEVAYQYIPREQNDEADRLCRETLDEMAEEMAYDETTDEMTSSSDDSW